MKIVVKKVGQEPEVREIPNELGEFQAIVGGYIECVYLGVDNICCICNEEGKLMGLTPNFIFNGDVIVGDVLFVGTNEFDFEGLTDEQVELIMSIMHVFEI